MAHGRNASLNNQNQEKPPNSAAMATDEELPHSSQSAVGSPELDSCNVFIKYLPTTLTDTGLYTLFSRFGEIVSAKVMVDPITGNSLGYGFCRFTKPEDAQKAIEAMTGQQLGNKTLLCKLSHGPGYTPHPPTDNLYVKPLLPETTEDDLRKLFEPFGKVVDCKVMVDKATGVSRQIGFVRFETIEQATLALNKMNGVVLTPKVGEGEEAPPYEGNPLVIKFAETKPQKLSRRAKLHANQAAAAARRLAALQQHFEQLALASQQARNSENANSSSSQIESSSSPQSSSGEGSDKEVHSALELFDSSSSSSSSSGDGNSGESKPRKTFTPTAPDFTPSNYLLSQDLAIFAASYGLPTIAAMAASGTFPTNLPYPNLYSIHSDYHLSNHPRRRNGHYDAAGRKNVNRNGQKGNNQRNQTNNNNTNNNNNANNSTNSSKNNSNGSNNSSSTTPSPGPTKVLTRRPDQTKVSSSSTETMTEGENSAGRTQPPTGTEKAAQTTEEMPSALELLNPDPDSPATTSSPAVSSYETILQDNTNSNHNGGGSSNGGGNRQHHLNRGRHNRYRHDNYQMPPMPGPIYPPLYAAPDVQPLGEDVQQIAYPPPPMFMPGQIPPPYVPPYGYPGPEYGPGPDYGPMSMENGYPPMPYPPPAMKPHRRGGANGGPRGYPPMHYAPYYPNFEPSTYQLRRGRGGRHRNDRSNNNSNQSPTNNNNRRGHSPSGQPQQQRNTDFSGKNSEAKVTNTTSSEQHQADWTVKQQQTPPPSEYQSQVQSQQSDQVESNKVTWAKIVASAPPAATNQATTRSQPPIAGR